eukprot:7715802-Pyramimonas_sp.AAC.1
MVFLPKAPSGHEDGVGDFFDPGDTRPLNIVNCDNRILANAVRKRIEPFLSEWVSHMQRGFLPGRSLLANVVDIDHAVMQCALCEESGVAVFLDFNAAFPSVSHQFLQDALGA